MKNNPFVKAKFSYLSLLKNTLFAALLFQLFFTNAKAQTAIGFVQEIRGSWYLLSNPSQSLRQGQKLPAGAVIKRQSASSDDRIIIANLRGELIDGASRRCGEHDCSGGIRLPASSPQKGYLSQAYDSVMGLIWGSPSKYSIHRSRSGEELADGIIKIEYGKLDLKGVLKKQGKYNLRWRTIPLSEGEKVGSWIETTAVEWSDNNSPGFSTEILKPGLYEVNLLETRGNSLQGTQTSAWVLIADTDAYKKNVDSLRMVSEMTKKWEGKVSDTNIKTFIRAYLEQLARQNSLNNERKSQKNKTSKLLN
jgi:hypothetical protein